MAKNTIDMAQAKELINFAIDRNLKLQEEGIMPIAVGLEATPGIGKTSIVRQIAEERGMNYTLISLSELEEAGDLIGFPLKEFEVQVAKLVKGEDGNAKVMVLPGTQWLTEKQIDTVDKNTKYKMTGKTRMSYAKPAWVPEFNEKGNIVCLDDFSRANPQLLQATMRLILEQAYMSWSLPKKTTIVLTSNSDDGSNNVNSLDQAQQTRFMNYNVEFSINPWIQWAEKVKLDNRCINFVANFSESLFNVDEQGNSICNPRSFVMFANMISGIKEWEKADNLDQINLIARGCFKDEAGRFAQMFSAFIRQKMHELISPKDMLLGNWDTTREKIEKCVYDDGGSWRPDIATLLSRRFSNYVLAWLESDGETPISKVRDRIHDFLDNETKYGKKLFNPELFYHMVKNITSEKKGQTGKLLIDPQIAKILS